jgi:hypothetical protein
MTPSKPLPRLLPRLGQGTATFAVALILLTGCQSKQDAAIDQAKKQAIATGQAQQVVSTDKSGNVTTTTITPPAAGQTQPTITATTTPATAANSAPTSGTANAPAPGAPPIIRPADINVPAGTNLAIRINEHIGVKTSRAGDHFTGEFVEPVTSDNGQLIIPKGTPVTGIVDASHARGHFKGASVLELRLTSLNLNGTDYPVDTHDLARTKKGKGKRTAGLIGGGAGLGMLIGGVASGGTGLLIGGLAGAGAGTAASAFTGNRDIDIPSESIVHFKLADTLTLTPAPAS